PAATRRAALPGGGAEDLLPAAEQQPDRDDERHPAAVADGCLGSLATTAGAGRGGNDRDRRGDQAVSPRAGPVPRLATPLAPARRPGGDPARWRAAWSGRHQPGSQPLLLPRHAAPPGGRHRLPREPVAGGLHGANLQPIAGAGWRQRRLVRTPAGLAAGAGADRHPDRGQLTRRPTTIGVRAGGYRPAVDPPRD